MPKTKMTKEDAICVLAVYHFADCKYAGPQAFRLLENEMPEHFSFTKPDSPVVGEWVKAKYLKLLQDYVQGELGDLIGTKWFWRHDFWGALGLFPTNEWNDPKSGGFYTGDSTGMPMLFSCMQAIEDYTKENIECMN